MDTSSHPTWLILDNLDKIQPMEIFVRTDVKSVVSVHVKQNLFKVSGNFH